MRRSGMNSQEKGERQLMGNELELELGSSKDTWDVLGVDNGRCFEM
jgi:hypothetical protein